MTAQELRLPPDDFFQSPSFKDLLEWMENGKNMLGSGMVDWERNETISDLTHFYCLGGARDAGKLIFQYLG
jgi:hypothetical protein